ncbi:MAG TPA: alpha-amylase family glycosyl hydrolase [bacterium]|nr:alpha-amylase family glycosyl hydrolase [bacterium]HPQ17919.1 alpha-amylase family glycosyl hydrolase [bacterium]
MQKKKKYYLYKLFIKFFLCVVFVFLFNVQISSAAYIMGTYTGGNGASWNSGGNHQFSTSNMPGGYEKAILWGISSGNEFLIGADAAYSTKYCNGWWIPGDGGHLNTIWNIPSGGSNAQFNGSNLSENKGYIIVTSSSSVNGTFGFMTTSAYPIYILSVSGGQGYYDSGYITISLTLSGAKCAEEYVLVRYVINGNWSGTHNLVQATGSDTNYSCSIYYTNLGDSIVWYALTSTLSNIPSDTDLLTLSAITNGGANYTFWVIDTDTTAPIITDSTIQNTYYDTDFVISLTMVDSSGISHSANSSRSRAYFSWNSTAGPYFYDTYLVYVSGNNYRFQCPYNYGLNNFSDSIGKKLYYYVLYADNDSGSYASSDADSKYSTLSGYIFIKPKANQLVINEVLDGANGEYIELYNNSSYYIDLQYIDIYENTTKEADAAGSSYNLSSGNYYLIADQNLTDITEEQIDAMDLANGTVYLYFENDLTNAIDSCALSYAGVSSKYISIERVSPDSPAGVASSWQNGVKVYYNSGESSLAAGTPHDQNTNYGLIPIYITEIMFNGAAGATADYIEIYNAGSDSYYMYNWSIYEEGTAEVSISDSIISANKYYLIESSEAATTISADLVDSMDLSNDRIYLYAGPTNSYYLIDQAGNAVDWATADTNFAQSGIACEKPTPAADGTNSVNWRNATSNIGGVIGSPGQASAVNAAPTVELSNIEIGISPFWLDYDTMCANKLMYITIVYTDINGATDITRVELIIGDGQDTINYYSVFSGTTAVNISGSSFIASGFTVYIDTSISGNNLTCTWAVKLNWSLTESSNFKVGGRATDDEPETGPYTFKTNVGYTKTFILSGTLVNNYGVIEGGWGKAGLTFVWSGLYAYYKSTTVYPEDDDFNFLLTDDDGRTTKQYGSAYLTTSFAVDTVSDTTEGCTVTITDITTGGHFDTSTTKGMSFKVDGSAPTISIPDNYFVFKGDTYTKAPGINIIFTNGSSGTDLDTATYRINNNSTLFTIFTDDCDSKNMTLFLNGDAYKLLDTTAINTITVSCTKVSGWSTSLTFQIQYEPIAIDGSIADWQIDEKLEIDGGAENLWFWCTWDDTYIYFAYEPKSLTDGDFFIYIDAINNNGSLNSVNWWLQHTFPAPYYFDNAICIDSSAYYDHRQCTTGSWVTVASLPSYIDAYISWSGVPVTELRIPWNNLTNGAGKPDTFAILAFQQWEDSGNVWTSYPTENPGATTNGNPVTFTNVYFYSDSSDTVSPKSVISTLINIDGGLGEWSDTSKLVSWGVSYFYLTCDDTYLYIGVDRNAYFPNATDDYDVICIYIDTDLVDNAGTDTTREYSSKTHTLPFKATCGIMYRPTSPYGNWFCLHKWTGAAWTDVSTSGYGNYSGQYAEIQMPWSDIGNPTSIRLVLYHINGSNCYLWAASPDGNDVGAAPKTLTNYYQYDLAKTQIRNDPANRNYSQTTATFSYAAETTTIAFTPYIDGTKDLAWGTVPLITSNNAAHPRSGDVGTDGKVFTSGYCDSVYVTNDLNYLYIGWNALGDHYNDEAQKSTHYMFFLFTDSSPMGLSYEPFKTEDKTTRVIKYSPDFCAEGYIHYGNDNFNNIYLYRADTGSWTNVKTLLSGTDYSVSVANGWGELKISLATLNLKTGDSVGIIYAARHAEHKPGLSDIAPFDAGTVYDWSDTGSLIDGSKAKFYRIQTSLLTSLTHRPNYTPVTGKTIMRYPLTPYSSQSPKITLGVSLVGAISNAYIIYSFNNWSTYDTVSLSFAYLSGSNSYFEGNIPACETKGATVKYYIKVPGNSGEINYVYGNDTSCTVTLTESTAQTNAFTYQIMNSPPTPPTSAELTPQTPNTNHNLLLQATGATDSDSDILTYIFEWYKNDTLYWTDYDSSPPYISSISAFNTSEGENWYCNVSVGDGLNTSSILKSNVVRISAFVVWSGTMPAEVNVGTVSESEWMWLDKTNDVRTVSTYPTNYDIENIRLKLDTQYLYFRIKFQDITNLGHCNILLAIDTDNASTNQTIELGDEANLYYGNGYYDSATPDIQFHIHNITVGSMEPIIEYKIGSGSWNDLNSSDYQTYLDTDADILEGKIKRSELTIANSGVINCRIISFKNNLVRAASGDATADYPENDALDVVSINGLYSNNPLYYNDFNKNNNVYYEELYDSKVDFYFSLIYDGNGIKSNNAPSIPDTHYPVGSVSDVPLTLSWAIASETDANDAVTSYLFELNTSSDFSGNVLYRVNIASGTRSFTIPSTLEGQRTYYWRVRARDKIGALSSDTVWTFYYQGPPSISVSAPLDLNNVDNYGRVQGNQSADSDINWYWAPAIHSAGWVIKDYNIQVFTDPTDTSTLVFSDTINGDAINGCTNNYAISYANRLLLVRGKTYYARIRAGDTATPQNWSSLSSASDGIYYCLKKIDGSVADWKSDTGWLNNSINFIGSPYYEAVWTDSTLDHRTDRATEAAYLDLSHFYVAIDKYNMYFYTKFTNYYDGIPYIQIAVDINDNSIERVFRGRNVSAEDVFTSTIAAWEYLINCVTGNDYVGVYNDDFQLIGYGKYADATGGSGFEFSVSLDDIGGQSEFYNDTVKLTVGIFWNDNNSIGDWAASVTNVNVVDCVSDKTTWAGAGNDEVGWSDQVIDYYLILNTDTDYKIKSASGTRPVSPDPIPESPNGVNPPSSALDYTFYNVFVDRFWNGNLNNAPYDPDMSGGDFDGLIKKIKDGYFSGMGITGLYLSPIFDYGGGVWGYNQHDLHRVQGSYVTQNWNKFYGWDDFVKLAKECHRHNMRLGLDWVPGQIYGDNNSGGTISRNQKMWFGERFGGRRILQYVSDVRQFFVDHSIFLYGLGASFFRVDNPKFYPDPLVQGLPFFVYQRRVWNEFTPDLYTFGEVPGDAGECATFCADGNRLHGMLDFPLSYPLKSWSSGGDAGTFRSTLEGIWSTYDAGAAYPIVPGYYENHDHDRCYHYIGDNMDYSKWNMQVLMMFLAQHIGPPIIFYGDERVMMGRKDTTYPGWQYTSSTSQFGNTRAFPWNSWENPPAGWPEFSGATNDIQAAVEKAMRARNIFSALRWNAGDRYFERASGSQLIIRRGTWDTKNVICLLNNNSSAVDFGNFYTFNTNTKYKDWFTGGTVWSDGSAKIANFNVGGKYAAFLVKDSFGLGKMYIKVVDGVDSTPLAEAIVSVDNKVVWTRETGTDGYVYIDEIVTTDGGSSQYYVKIWKKGYKIYNMLWTFYDGVQIEGTIGLERDDGVPPAAPAGLSGKARAKGALLRWSQNTEDDFESYYLYRSTTPVCPAVDDYIIETIRPIYMDSNFDRSLTIGETYYYWVRAKDRNDNVSAPSNMIAIVPHKVLVTFQVDMSQSGFGTIDHVYIKGNAYELGRCDFNESYKMPDIDPLVEMTHIGRGIYEKTVELDPMMYVNYLFVCQHDGGQWYDEWGFRTATYENAREIQIVDSKDWTQAVVHRWMTGGDVAPQKPIGLTAVPKNMAIKLGWSLNLEADMENYEIWRSTDGTNYGSAAYAYVEKNQINYTDYNVSNGSTYYYKIKAVDKNGYASEFSDPVSAVPTSDVDETPPAVPTGLLAEGYGLGTVKLTWNYNTDGDLAGYNVYRATTSNFSDSVKLNSAIITPSFEPYYLDTGVTNGVQYYYAVSAVDDYLNESSRSSSYSVKLARLTFRVDMGGISVANVNFIANANYIGLTTGKTMTYDSATNSTYYFTSDFVVGYNLQYKYAYNDVSTIEGDFNTGSKYRELTIPDVVSDTYIDDWENYPDKITNLTAQPDSGAVWLFWSYNTTNEDLKGYNIYKQNYDGSFTKINADTEIVTTNYYRVSNLTNGTQYNFTVRCVDSGDLELESENSNIVSATPNSVVWVHFRN